MALRRSFQRLLNRMPTVRQSMLIDSAAIMQARFEAAALDPSTTHNDLVRLSGEARRSRLDMEAAFDKLADVGDGASSLDAYLDEAVA
jgi:hypothetical protein